VIGAKYLGAPLISASAGGLGRRRIAPWQRTWRPTWWMCLDSSPQLSSLG